MDKFKVELSSTYFCLLIDGHSWSTENTAQKKHNRNYIKYQGSKTELQYLS